MNQELTKKSKQYGLLSNQSNDFVEDDLGFIQFGTDTNPLDKVWVPLQSQMN